MIFNSYRFLKTLSVLVFAFGAQSCSEFLKGKPVQKEVLEIKQESSSCLKDVSLQVDRFLKEQTKNEDIDRTFNCIEQIIKDFQTKVEGREKADAFNAEELHQIFNQFMDDRPISKDAVKELLLFKAAVLGGSEQSLTKLELSQLRDLLKLVKFEMKNIAPFVKIITFADVSSPETKNRIKLAFDQLNKSLKTLLKSTSLARTSYRLDDLKKLFYSLNLIQEKDEAMVGLVDNINNFITGSQDIMSVADRELYVDNITDAMRIYAAKVHGYADLKMDTPENLRSSISFLEECLNFVESTLQFKKSNMIAVETIDPVLTSVHKAKVLPVDLKLDTMLSFYKTLMVRVYQYGPKIDAETFKGLERIHLLNIRFFKLQSAFYKIQTLL